LRFIVFYCGKRGVLLYYEHLFILRVLSMKLTRAITHIRLSDANPSKLAQLDARHVAFVQSQDRRSRSSRREPTFGCESISGQSGVGEDQRLAS
jgi:hypothetical protein